MPRLPKNLEDFVTKLRRSGQPQKTFPERAQEWGFDVLWEGCDDPMPILRLLGTINQRQAAVAAACLLAREALKETSLAAAWAGQLEAAEAFGRGELSLGRVRGLLESSPPALSDPIAQLINALLTAVTQPAQTAEAVEAVAILVRDLLKARGEDETAANARLARIIKATLPRPIALAPLPPQPVVAAKRAAKPVEEEPRWEQWSLDRIVSETGFEASGRAWPYLERYLRGECTATWDALMALGEAVRRPDVHPDSVAVARETMRRARHNVATLLVRLRKVGYRLADPTGGLKPPQSGARLRGFATPVPVSLAAFEDVVGTINLRGRPATLSAGGGWGRDEDRDPLVVEPTLSEGDSASPDGYVRLFPDAVLKAGMSGLGFLDTKLPSALADALIEYEGAPVEREGKPLTLVRVLRASFEAGGFPGLRTQGKASQRLAHSLAQGLCPI